LRARCGARGAAGVQCEPPKPLMDLQVHFSVRIVAVPPGRIRVARAIGRIKDNAVRERSSGYNKAWEQIMAGRLQGKAALVTGATSNIGRAIAEAFAVEGAHVVISGRSAQRGAQVVDGIRSRGGHADFVMAELDGSAEASRSLAGQATSVLGGRIDILVNNAGIYPGDSTAATDEKTFDRVYAVNVKAPFFLTAAIAPAMVEAGSGAIINLGSWIARLGIPIGALYSSTKGAVETLTRAWAAEVGPSGVRVHAISPGGLPTPAPDAADDRHPGAGSVRRR